MRKTRKGDSALLEVKGMLGHFDARPGCAADAEWVEATLGGGSAIRRSALIWLAATSGGWVVPSSTTKLHHREGHRYARMYAGQGAHAVLWRFGATLGADVANAPRRRREGGTESIAVGAGRLMHNGVGYEK